MNKTVCIVLFLVNVMACSTVFAGSGPDSIQLKTVVPFQHWKHQVSPGVECVNCHKPGSGKIENWGKDAAHELCIACHDLNEKGPVECKQCHK